MKYFTTFLLLVSFLLVTSNFAQDSAQVKKRVTNEMIEESLLVGAKSGNEGLSISSAYYLGETKSEAAVIPLMAMLKNSNSSEQAKVMAALSLFKIGDERGIFAIKQSIEFEQNETVKKMCKIFYEMHLQAKKVEAKN
jgi:HEAT repeat protein